MTRFAYQARTGEGQLLSGMILAEDADNASEVLNQRNLCVVSLREQMPLPVHAKVTGHASRAQVAWQMSQLSIMVETGMPLSEALDCLARQAVKPRLRLLLERVSQSVREGMPLSDAMAMHPRSYPASLVAMIRAGEVSGTMGQVLHRAAGYLMNEWQAIKRLRAALMYPLFMFVACLGVTAFLLVVILPRFAGVFASRGAILPWPTRVLMAMSDSLMTQWPFWLVGMATAGLILWWWPRSGHGRRQCDRALITVPVLAPIFNALYQSRTFRTFSVLLDAGVPLVDVMDIVRDVSPNVYYRRLWMEVDEHIRHGERMAGPILASTIIAEPIAHMIDNGDRAGKLGLVFGRLAAFMEEQYDQTLRTATQMLEPVMIVFMGGVVGFIAASLMLPLFQAGQIMSR